MIELPKRAPGSKTITLDNGAEFVMHSLVSKAVKADINFAKPYASYQREINESTNIIRCQWPKKTAFGQISEDEAMQFQINSMPRKVLGGLTPLEGYTGRSVVLIALFWTLSPFGKLFDLPFDNFFELTYLFNTLTKLLFYFLYIIRAA